MFRRSVPGSHLFKTDTGHGREDADIMKWAEGKVHPVTGEALAVRRLEGPPRSVVVMWTQYAMMLRLDRDSAVSLT